MEIIKRKMWKMWNRKKGSKNRIKGNKYFR